MPHVDAAYNLAYWMTRNASDAQDVVQEGMLRAWRFFPTFRGGDACAWLLSVVRNTCYTWLEKNRAQSIVPFDDDLPEPTSERISPEETMIRHDEERSLKEAIEQLPLELREVLVLRELQELSYKEIAAIFSMPLGTVMSRLSRARDRLEDGLRSKIAEESRLGL
jgi:RNA polymerase sigma-70 factor (ECF subfamily)